MSKHHVVVVDDAHHFREGVAEYLSRNGFEVSQAASGAEFRAIVAGGGCDLAIIDLELPDEDGFDLVRHLRQRDGCGIIIMTANNDPTEIVVGLELGADDYVVKPLPMREILARVRTVLRRTADTAAAVAPEGPRAVTFGDWTLDTRHRALKGSDGALLELTGGEYALMTELGATDGAILGRDHLMRAVFQRDWQYDDRGMDVLVARLRKKLVPTGLGCHIKSVRGTGYTFDHAGLASEIEAANADGNDGGPRR
jgi:two-component system OmpR family response regulator